MKSGFLEICLPHPTIVTPTTLSPPVAFLSPGLHPGAACGQLAVGED